MREAKPQGQLESPKKNKRPFVLGVGTTFYVYHGIVLANNWDGKTISDAIKLPEDCSQYIHHEDFMKSAVYRLSGLPDGIYYTNRDGTTRYDIPEVFLTALKAAEQAYEFPVDQVFWYQHLRSRGDNWERTGMYANYFNPNDECKFLVEVHAIATVSNCTNVANDQKIQLEPEWLTPVGVQQAKTEVLELIQKYEMRIPI